MSISVRKRKNGKNVFQSQTIVSGKRFSKTFLTKAEARNWIGEKSKLNQLGVLNENITLSEVIEQFKAEHGHEIKSKVIFTVYLKFWSEKLGYMNVQNITPP